MLTMPSDIAVAKEKCIVLSLPLLLLLLLVPLPVPPL
jgi:hypothetical protein